MLIWYWQQNWCKKHTIWLGKSSRLHFNFKIDVITLIFFFMWSWLYKLIIITSPIYNKLLLTNFQHNECKNHYFDLRFEKSNMLHFSFKIEAKNLPFHMKFTIYILYNNKYSYNTMVLFNCKITHFDFRKSDRLYFNFKIDIVTFYTQSTIYAYYITII